MKRHYVGKIFSFLLLFMSFSQNVYSAAVLERGAAEGAGEAFERGSIAGGEAAVGKATTKAAQGAENATAHVGQQSSEFTATAMKDVHAPQGEMPKITTPQSGSFSAEDVSFSKSGSAGKPGGATMKAPETIVPKELSAPGKATTTASKGTSKGAASESNASEATIKAPKNLTASQTKEIDNMSSDAKEAFNKMTPEEQANFFKDESVAGKNARSEWAKNVDAKVAEGESKKFFSVKGMTVKGTVKGLGGKLVGITEIIGMAVLFMIPSIFESAFLAEQQRNALLMTYSTPIQFGNIVLQIPDSEINLEEPSTSDFIYYGIPVDAIGNPLTAGAAAMYPGVTGPDRNNAVSKGITSGYAKAFSLGKAKTTPPPARYNLDASALSTLPIFVSYSENSWDEWGASAINDPSFSQMLINLNTGMIFYADGLSDNTPPAPLVGTTKDVKSVESALSIKLGKLSTEGTISTFTEYSDTFSSSKGNKAASPISSQFNCACLNKNENVLSADTIALCNVAGSSTCLLVPTLNRLAAGMIINSTGKPLTKDQDLATEIAAGALGQVIPIQGMGDKFSDYLDFFPGAEDDAMSSSNLTISYGFLNEDGSSAQDTKKPKIQGAQPDNYTAKGVYVYQCKNTPFAKMLKSQAGGSATSAYNDHIFDFIVFFDHELNQVPLMVPMEDPNNYNFPTMQMNPAIEYWSTIIGSTDSQGNFSYLPQLMVVPAKGAQPIVPLYGLQAQGGHFKVNSNAQLISKLGAIVQDLQGHADLGEQFKATQDALLQLTKQGPFGKYNLRPIDPPGALDSSIMTPVIAGVKMPVYIGYNAYPVSQDEKATNCNDVLIPISADGSTAVLPSSSIVGYYGMVSDLSYAVASDGSLVVSSNKNSCFSQTVNGSGQQIWKIDDTKASSYYWLTQLTTLNNKQLLPQPLIDYVHAARANWIAWVKKTNASPISNVELAGVTWVGLNKGKHILKIIDQQALVNNLYVYTCMINPSKIAQDFFVLTDSQNPVTTDATLGTISATKAKPTTNMLSLV